MVIRPPLLSQMQLIMEEVRSIPSVFRHGDKQGKEFQEGNAIPMNYMKNQTTNYLIFTVLALFIFSGHGVSFSQERAESKVIFYVQ